MYFYNLEQQANDIFNVQNDMELKMGVYRIEMHYKENL